ncbi:hypothetical protein HW132_34630 [Brasilonema sp. CT11]|nr:hypothetical protein [Brasilonema sp. CT11]
MPERISQRVRESGVFRHEDYPVQTPPEMAEDYQLSSVDPEMNRMTEPPKIFGAVKVGVVLNAGDLNRRLAATGNTINHRGSITATDQNSRSTSVLFTSV